MDVSRINKLKDLCREMKVDAILADDPVDLLYLTGLSFSIGRMLVSSESATLFVDGRYIESAKKQALCEVQLPSELGHFAKPFKKIAFDSAFITYEGYQNLRNTFPDLDLVPVAKPLKKLRMVKEETEIQALKKAAQLTKEGFSHIKGMLKEGISEEELSLEFEFFCRRKGASCLSFPPIIAFGENSAYPHHRAGKDRLKKNQIVLFDLGAVVNGYAGDMTRVAFFGNPSPQLQKDYALIQAVQKKVIAMVAPGICFGDLDKLARQELEKEGCASLFSHGLSHGIGLDVHEYPSLKIKGGDREILLEPGMVFTVEPGIYRVGIGGVRYEDVILVTKTGHEEL